MTGMFLAALVFTEFASAIPNSNCPDPGAPCTSRACPRCTRSASASGHTSQGSTPDCESASEVVDMQRLAYQPRAASAASIWAATSCGDNCASIRAKRVGSASARRR